LKPTKINSCKKLCKLIKEKSYGCYSHWAIAMKYWRDF